MLRLSVLLTCLTSLSIIGFSQVLSNGTGGGVWSDPGTWQGGVVPDFNSAAITILSGDVVNVDTDFTIDETTVDNGATLVVDAGAVLTINNGTGTDITINGSLQVDGEFVLQHNATHAGTSATTVSFTAGSIYRHQYTTAQGSIPLATWDPDSELSIEGYTSAFTANAAGNWSQNFGNLTWNCASQSGISTLAGLLTSVNNMEVLSTGASTLRLSVDQIPTIEIGGNLTIGGTSRIEFSTTGVGTTINIGGNFIFNSTNAVGTRSYLTTTGSCIVNIAGNFSMNAPGGELRFSSGTDGSGTLNIGADFDLIAGTLTESGGGASNGRIIFVGNDVTHLFSNSGLISNTINYIIPVDNTVIVQGESQFRGNANSSLTVDGTLVVQSENGTGAIVTGAGTGVGNIRVTNRIYNPGAIIVYGGTGQQFIGNGQPNVAGTLTVIENAADVALNTTAATVVIGGDLEVRTGNLIVELDNLQVDGAFTLSGGNVLFTTSGTARTITSNGSINLDGGDIIISSGTANANLIVNGDLTGGNFISFSGANSNLTINGTDDLSIDFPLSGPTTLENITITRGNNGSVVFPDEMTISNILTVNGGNVTLNGATLVNNDLTINGGSVATNASLTVNDDLNINLGSTLFFEGQTLELRSQYNNTLAGGLLFANASSTLNVVNTGILGTIEFAPAGNTLGDFYIERGTAGTLVTLNSQLTIANTFTLFNGDFLNSSGLTMAAGASLTRNNLAAFSAGSVIPAGGPYDLIYSGTALTTGVEAQGNLENLISNTSGTVTVSSAITVANTLSVNSGTFTCGANTISTDVLSLSGTLNAQTSTIALTGDFINNGTFNRNTGTVQFNGNSSIGGLNNPSFQDVVINGALTPPSTFNLHGSFTNNGIFNNSGTGTVAFLGTAATTQVVSGSSVTNFNNISVSNTTAVPDVLIESNQNLTGVLTLAPTATFDADGAADNRIFTLISSSDDPTQDAAIATFPNAAAQVQGNVTVQRYMSLEGTNDRIYRYISSPIQNASVADLQNEIPITGSFTGSSTCSGCLTNPSMFNYDETVTTGGIDGGYVAFPVTTNSETLIPGSGYAIFVRGNIEPFLSAGSALWNVRGPVNRDNINYGVSFTSSGVPVDDGWNLVGNPYPSTIDWDAPTGWTRANVSGTIYTRNNATGQYATYTSGSGGTNGGSRYIAMGQGFWVQTTGASPNMASNEQVKSAGTQTEFFRDRSETNILKFAISKGTLRDEAIIHFRDDATDGFDFHADGWKLPNATINLSSIVDGVGKMSINSVGDFNCTKIVQLDVAGVTPGTYAFDFTSVETFESYIGLTLMDNFTGEEIDLRNQSNYTFQVTSDASSYGDNRFAIRFTGAEVSNDFIVEANTELCSDADLRITISNSQPDVMYQVFKGSVGISTGVTGNGETIEVVVPSSALTPGVANLTLKGSLPGCSVEQNMLVNRVEIIEAANASGDERCLSGSVELSVSNTTGFVRWYDAADALSPIAEGTVFSTPELTSSKTYFVSVANALGCEGIRVPVQAIVHQYELAEISTVGNTLLSNHDTGNQWYLNGVAIDGATEPYFEAEVSGLYSLAVTTMGGCQTSADRQFVVTSAESALEQYIHVYPNPVRNRVQIEVMSAEPVEVKLLNTLGVKLSGKMLTGTSISKHAEFDLTNQSNGMYILHVQKGGRVHQVKIIKTNE